ncbi:hypothetical protein BT69DRAFT_1288598 [Atractiella rhizophila]|nr:hypothetical protein BT69DRAFT_1288598 [Atractiella rhizophila]
MTIFRLGEEAVLVKGGMIHPSDGRAMRSMLLIRPITSLFFFALLIRSMLSSTFGVLSNIIFRLFVTGEPAKRSTRSVLGTGSERLGVAPFCSKRIPFTQLAPRILDFLGFRSRSKRSTPSKSRFDGL